MERTRLGTSLLSAITLSASVLFMTCTVGLGSKIDTEAPIVTVDSPAIDSILGNKQESLSFSGMSQDETRLASVTVTMAAEAGVGTAYGPFTATLNPSKTGWSLNLANKTDAGYFLPDGIYKMCVTAKDAIGRTGVAYSIYTIDNTNPTVMATSPLTYLSDSQPTFYRTIDIKGEVYDATQLAKVVVQLCKPDGTVVDSRNADGTNTFSARFKYTTGDAILADGGTYYYNIIATDSAGNSNTYFFHRFDIYPLLSLTDGYASFPSMYQLGQLDQIAAVSSIAEAGLSKDQLSTVRLGPAGVLSPKYPDFLFRNQDAISIKWLNLAGDDSVIGPSVPIVGTIMPPADGSSIKRSSIACVIETSVEPIVRYAQTVESAIVGSGVNFQIQPVDATGAALKTGNYKVSLSFTTNSGSSGSEGKAFGISAGAPYFTDTATGSASEPFIQSVVSASSTLVGYAHLSDGQPFTSPTGLTYTLDGGAPIPILPDSAGRFSIAVPAPADHGNDGSHTYSITAVSGVMSSTISRTFVVDTYQPAISFLNPTENLWLDAASGTITLAGTAADAYTTGDATKNGSGVTAVYWLVDAASADHSADANFRSPSGSWKKASGTITWSAEYAVSGEGALKLWAIAEDSAGNVSRASAAFGADVSKPSLFASTPSAFVRTATQAGKKITGTASDTNGLSALTATVNGGSPIDVAVAAGVWSFDPPIDYDDLDPTKPLDKTYAVTLTAMDIAGKQTSVTRSFAVDATPPSITVNNLNSSSSTNISDAAFLITGSTGDPSGVSGIGYSMDHGASWTQIPVDAAWSLGVTSGLTENASGVDIRFRAEDRAGNLAVTGDYNIKLDCAPPRASVASHPSSSISSRADVVLSGLADDASITAGRAASSAVIAYSRDGISLTPVSLSPVLDADGPDNDVSTVADNGFYWTWTLPAVFPVDSGMFETGKRYEITEVGTTDFKAIGAKDNTIGAQFTATGPGVGNGKANRIGERDGFYVVTLTVVDQAGKSSSVTRTVQIDTTGPTLAIAYPGANDFVDAVSVAISGSVRDTGGVGFDSALDLEYTLSYSADGNAANDGWLDMTPSINGTQWQLTGVPLVSEGLKTLSIRSTDALGNASMESVDFSHDVKAPKISETTAGVTGIYRSANFSFGGSWTESNSLSTIQIAYRKDGGDETAYRTIPVGANGANVAWPAVAADGVIDVDLDGAGPDTGLGEGTYVFTILATDVAGRTSSETRNIVIDTTAPTFAVTTPADISDATVWRTVSPIFVSGTGTEAGSGIASVEYRVSGGSWVACTFANSGLDVYAWNAAVALEHRSNTLELRATDKSGKSSQASYVLRADLQAPVLIVTPPLGYSNCATTHPVVSVSAKDLYADASASSGIKTLKYKVNSGDFSSGTILAIYSPTSGSSNDGTWDNDLSSLFSASGSYTVYLRAEDVAGNKSDYSFMVSIDMTPPSASISAVTPIADGNRINGTVTLSASATDNVALDGATWEYCLTADTANADGSAVAGPWTPFTDAGNARTTIDTSAFGASSADTARLWVRVRDSIGNTGYAYQDRTVDQSTDRPIVKLTNLVTDGSALLQGTVVYGTISDDDGIVKSLKVSADGGATWPAADLNGDAFTFSLPTGIDDGAKTLYFRIVQTENGVDKTFESGSAVSPRVLKTIRATSIVSGTQYTIVSMGSTDFTACGATAAQNVAGGSFTASGAATGVATAAGTVYATAAPYTGAHIDYKLDTKDPTILDAVSVSTDDGATWAPLSASSYYRTDSTAGNASKVRVRVSSWDANGLDDSGVSLVLSGTMPCVLTAVSGAGTSAASPRVYQTGEINLKLLPDGVATALVTAKDNSGREKQLQANINVDNTAPSVAFSSPAKGAIVYGSQTISGNGFDNKSGVVAVYYQIGKASDPAVNSPSWILASSSGSFDIDMTKGAANGNLGIDYYATASHAVETYSGSGLWQLPFVVKVVDAAGNAKVSSFNATTPSSSDFYLCVNPGGDKPTVALVYPYDTSIPLGGTIRLQGTATDTEGVYKVYLQIDGNMNGTFENNDVNLATGKDWGNFNNITGELGVPVTGTNAWNIQINTSNEFDPPSGTRSLKCRVRAQDTKNGTTGDVFGPWTEFTVLIDLDSPTITNLRLDPDANPANGNEIPYTQGMDAYRPTSGEWTLRGTLADNIELKSIQVTSADSALCAKWGTAGSLNGTWFTQTVPGSDKSYEMALPITVPAGSASTVSLKITIADNNTDPREAQMPVSVDVDGKAPQCEDYTVSGVPVQQFPIVQSNGKYKYTAIASDEGTDVNRIEVYFVRQPRSGSTTQKRFYWPKGSKGTPPGWTSTYDVGASDTIDVSNGTFDYPVANSKFVVKVDSFTELGGAEGSTPDGDMYNEYIKQDNGNKYKWYVEIDSASIPDGPMEMHYIVWDNAGNGTHYTQSGSTVKVQNNGPLVGKVWLGCDLNADGAIDMADLSDANAEVQGTSFVKVANADAKLAEYFASRDTGYVVKGGQPNVPGANALKILPEVVNGNGNLYYRVMYESGQVKTGTLRSGAVVTPIALTTSEMGAIGESAVGVSDDKAVTVEVWDSTDETINGDNAPAAPATWTSLSVKPSVGMAVRLQDTAPPKAVVNRFNWASATENNLYDDDGNALTSNGKSNGHVEIVGVIDGDDPDVSGKISIFGTAWDDQQLSAIYLYLTDFAFDNCVQSSGSDVEKNFMVTPESAAPTSLPFSKVASYKTGVGAGWTYGAAGISGDHWKFTVLNDSFTKERHLISWRLDIDTAFVSNAVGKDKMLRVAVEDKIDASVNENAHTDLAQAGSDTVAPDPATTNRQNYRMDVVPYVSGVTTALSKAYPSNPSVFQRTALGYYPVREGETVTLTGFNLGGSSAVLSLNGTAITPIAGGTNESVSFTVPTNASKAYTGALSVSYSGIAVPNNLDVTEPAYNMRPNGVNNDKLTDDLYFYLWTFNQVVSDATVRYPTMRVGNDANQTVAFVYDSGAQLAKMNLGGSDFILSKSYTQWYDTAVAVDASGVGYGSSMNGDSGGGVTDADDQDMNNSTTYGATGGYANYQFFAGTTATNAALNVNTGAYRRGARCVALENAYNGDVFNSNRVQNPRIATGPSGAVYTTYYESTSGQLRFRYGTATIGATTTTFGGALRNHGNANNGSGTGYQVIAGTGATGTSTSLTTTNLARVGRYSSVGVTTGGVAVVAWYDAANQALLYSWNDAPTSAASAANWGTNTIAIDTDFAGWYVDLAVDAGNGVHIAYYSSSSGDLKYAYLPTYSSTPQVCTVDSYLSTGSNIAIATQLEGGKYVPYISYYSSAFTQTKFSVRVAYRKDMASATSVPDGVLDDSYTGAWEIMAVPTNSVALDYQIGVGIKKNAMTVNKPLLGYGTTAGLETATLK